MRTPTAFERERAEGEGAFFGRSIASEKKVRRPVKHERLKTIASRVFFFVKRATVVALLLYSNKNLT